MINTNFKTILTVSLAVPFAFFIVFLFVNLYANQYDLNTLSEKKFYQHLDPNQKKIFLLGSSQVGRLNVTYINQVISDTGYKDYVVYDVGKSNDYPKKRLDVVDEMVEAKPSIVIYGVGYRDFGYIMQLKPPISTTVTSQEQCENFEKNTKLLPDPKQLFEQLMPSSFEYPSLDDPKDVALNFLKQNKISQVSINYTNPLSPFYVPNAETNQIMSDEKMIDTIRQYCYYKDFEEENTERLSIKQIIDKLEQNHIRVILYVVPYDKFSLENIPVSEKKSFNFTVSSIVHDYNLHVYSFENKYSHIRMWQWPGEVATLPDSINYSQDVSNIILKEIQS